VHHHYYHHRHLYSDHHPSEEESKKTQPACVPHTKPTKKGIPGRELARDSSFLKAHPPDRRNNISFSIVNSICLILLSSTFSLSLSFFKSFHGSSSFFPSTSTPNKNSLIPLSLIQSYQQFTHLHIHEQNSHLYTHTHTSLSA